MMEKRYTVLQEEEEEEEEEKITIESSKMTTKTK